MRAKQAKNYGKSPKPPFDDGNVPEHLHQLISAVRGIKDPEMLDHFTCLSDEYHVLLRAALAKNEHTPKKTILKLLSDQSPLVVLAAISSNHAAAEALEPLAHHKNQSVREAALAKIAGMRRESDAEKPLIHKEQLRH
ncbi:MAG: hypothetical protein M1321_00600 [Candidatus Marsarchaeota archaeon]|nr:hypothetical protein [Candidatus Marsarchaeota archaeon]